LALEARRRCGGARRCRLASKESAGRASLDHKR
jgi:hypothetical protein